MFSFLPFTLSLPSSRPSWRDPPNRNVHLFFFTTYGISRLSLEMTFWMKFCFCFLPLNFVILFFHPFSKGHDASSKQSGELFVVGVDKVDALGNTADRLIANEPCEFGMGGFFAHIATSSASSEWGFSLREVFQKPSLSLSLQTISLSLLTLFGKGVNFCR